MKIPFLDLNANYRELQSELDAAYQRVMEQGWFILGSEVEAFEREFATYCGVAHCIGVGNGLDSLRLILEAYGIGAGDEVLVPSHTFIATWLAVSHAGATPVPVEVDPGTYNLDPRLLASAITPRTRAVIPVHLYGRPADMKPILAIAREKGLKVIEDAAQAHGACHKGRRTGGLADAAGFSFYPGKNLGAFGDAGAVLTQDDDLAERIRKLRNYGCSTKYVTEVKGYNSRLDPLQAAFLDVKLKHLDRWNRQRETIASWYREGLGDLDAITLPSISSPGVEHVWHIFAVRCRRRDELQEHMTRRSIGTLIHYPVPPHLSAAYTDRGWKSGSFPVTETIAQEVLSLPMWPQLTKPMVEDVIAGIREFVRG